VIAPLALEVIAASLDDALAAEQGGAARIELVAWFERGGLTPSLELVDAVLSRMRIPVRVMVRDSEPHEVADPLVRRRLVEQARAVGEHPVDGLVFGALVDGRIDEALLDAVGGAAGRPITFHRAFEELANPEVGLATLARHPMVDRVLCDGGSGDWYARAERLRAWSVLAGPGLHLLPGGGITEEALTAISRVAALQEVHVGRLVREPPSASGVVSARRVADLVARLGQLRPPGPS
jgi:copper homeostasis protein